VADDRICRGREFQLLGEDTQKALEAKEGLAQGGTVTVTVWLRVQSWLRGAIPDGEEIMTLASSF